MVQNAVAGFGVVFGREDAAHEKSLKEVADQLTAAGFNVKAKVIPGNPAKVISQRVESDDVDLLVMGAYGHSHIREFFVGSTTTKLVRSCVTPVLMFH